MHICRKNRHTISHHYLLDLYLPGLPEDTTPKSPLDDPLDPGPTLNIWECSGDVFTGQCWVPVVCVEILGLRAYNGRLPIPMDCD